jgi:hypothetical protein
MPNLDPWLNRSSSNNIQNDNDNDNEDIEEKYLFDDNIDVFSNEENSDDDDDNEYKENE